MTLRVERFAGNPALLTTSTPIGADIKRLVLEAYALGERTGRDVALIHLEPLIRDTRSDLQLYRALRNRSQREMTDFRVYEKAAGATAVLLRQLLRIRRALKGAHR